MYRSQILFGKDPSIVRKSKTMFYAPFKWQSPSVIFVCSWSDFFHDSAREWRSDAWSVMRDLRRHQFFILTKRPENIKHALPDDWGSGYPNVWFGVTVESAEYIYRIRILEDIPAIHRFISYEPALGFVHFTGLLNKIDWLITGGESGPGARPSDMKWFDHSREVCEFCGVPFFFKQRGGTTLIDGVWGGKKLFGQVYQSVPKSLKEIFAFHQKHPSCP